MDALKRIQDIFAENIAVKQHAAAALGEPIRAAAQTLIQCLADGCKILVCGNGGSAGDAQHLSSELLNRFERPRDGFAAVSLTTDTSTLTSIANDYDYREVFSRQITALGRSGDVLVVITTSGHSPNIVAAVRAAHQRGMRVVALTGKDGGDVAPLMDAGDAELRVPSTVTARIQETHILIIHCLCDLIEDRLNPGGSRTP